MKERIILFLFLFVVQVSFAQIDTTKIINSVLEKGNLMADSFQEGDYDTYLDLTHPKIISLSGGREKLTGMFKQGLGEGVEIISMELSSSNKLITLDNNYQCTLSQKQVMSVDGQKMYTLGTLIGISYDKGNNWVFIGVAQNTLEKLQVHFPELSDELDVQTQTYPILISE